MWLAEALINGIVKRKHPVVVMVVRGEVGGHSMVVVESVPGAVFAGESGEQRLQVSVFLGNLQGRRTPVPRD